MVLAFNTPLGSLEPTPAPVLVLLRMPLPFACIVLKHDTKFGTRISV